MIRFFRNRSLVFLFSSLFVVVTLIASLFIFIIFQYRLTNLIVDEKLQDNTVSAINISNGIENHFRSELNIIEGVSNTLDIYMDLSESEKEQYFNNVLNDSHYLSSIEFLDENMMVIASYPESEYRIGYDLSHPINNLQFNLHGYAWSKPYTTPSYDDMVMSLAYKFEDKYIYATYSLDFFEQVSDELRSASESKKLMILDEYGIFVYDS